MMIRDRIQDFRRVPASKILPNPKNWRTHSEKQANAMRATLAEIGFADAVLVRETPNGLMLIDGHLRTETAGDAIVPVLVLDVTELEADKLLATLDPLAAMAGQDTEKMADLFRSLKESGDDLVNHIWPDYIVDPLLTADWQPPTQEALPDREQQEHAHSIKVNEEQEETWRQAYAHAKKEMNHNKASEGEALAWICEQWLGRIE